MEGPCRASSVGTVDEVPLYTYTVIYVVCKKQTGRFRSRMEHAGAHWTSSVRVPRRTSSKRRTTLIPDVCVPIIRGMGLNRDL